MTEVIRMVQTNLRETDGGLDPEELVRQLRDLGANTLLFNAGGILAWYPTRIKYHRINPYMEGNLLGEVVARAHEAGVRVIGRLDLSKCSQPALDERPGWFYLSPKGNRVDYNGQFHTCINGGYYREQGGAILREVLDNYPVDGIFFNMFGFWTRDYSGNYHGICHCDGCKEAFRAEAGMELPASEEAGTPDLDEYRRFTQAKVAETAQFMHDVAREFGDHIAVSTWMFHPAIDIIRMESNRSLHRASPEFHHLHSAWAVNRVRTSYEDRTVCCCANHFFDIPYRFASEPAGLTAARIAGNLAAGGHLDFYMLGTFDQPDKEGFAPIREVYQHQERHEPLYTDLRSLARVLLVENAPHSAAVRGFYTALMHKQIPFDVLAAERLEQWGQEDRLRDYAVIIMPDNPDLPYATGEALDSFVKDGGRLIAAGRTGFVSRDETGPWGASRLACIGLETATQVLDDSRATYCMLDDDPLEELPETRAFLVHGAFASGHALSSAETLYPVQRGLYGPPEKCQWWDDASNSPVKGEYGAYRMPYGEGESVYFPFDLGRLYWLYYQSAHRELIGHWVRRFLATDENAPRVGVHGAPMAVQLSAHRIGESRDAMVHLVNYSGCQKNHCEMPLPVQDVTLYGTGSPARVRALEADEDLDIHRGAGGWSVILRELRLFEALVIEEML
jgi:hypothetical protein